MLRKPVVLITGANGEIGHGLIDRLSESGGHRIITLDLNSLDDPLVKRVHKHFSGSILDVELLDRVLAEYEIDLIFHLAALLSTRSEFAPANAHRVNVEGTLYLLEFAQKQGESHGRPVVFMYPSSIAAYGLRDLDAKRAAGKVKEDDHLMPMTIYGANKLYCEHLGRYYAHHYKQLAAEPQAGRVDFRSIRFPGLISATTIPSGGTSDYAPEMIHAAAQGKPYTCFVRLDTRIPFMAMPDGIDAMLRLAHAGREQLSRTVYNIAAFNPSAEEIQRIVTASFPFAETVTKVDAKRQGIVDSWPEDVDDFAARNDWGHIPKYDLQTAFDNYLIPLISRRHSR